MAGLTLPIILLAIIFWNLFHDRRPTTDKIYIWTEDLEESARRLKLRYVSDENIADREIKVTAEDIAFSERSTDLGYEDPTAEPELPFGRYGPPQYSRKEISSLGLELWIKKMHGKQESINIDKRCNHLYKESISELRKVGMEIINAQEITTGTVYSAGIDASGFDTSIKERVIARVRIYGTLKSDISVVELSVFSRDEEQVTMLSEQLKQSLWQ